eukprot:1672837-Alexandrium_andersonii.AAC.1
MRVPGWGIDRGPTPRLQDSQPPSAHGKGGETIRLKCIRRRREGTPELRPPQQREAARRAPAPAGAAPD